MSSRPLQAKLLQAQNLKIDCVLILEDGSEIACNRVMHAGFDIGDKGKRVIVECADGTEETFDLSEVKDLRLG